MGSRAVRQAENDTCWTCVAYLTRNRFKSSCALLYSRRFMTLVSNLLYISNIAHSKPTFAKRRFLLCYVESLHARGTDMNYRVSIPNRRTFPTSIPPEDGDFLYSTRPATIPGPPIHTHTSRQAAQQTLILGNIPSPPSLPSHVIPVCVTAASPPAFPLGLVVVGVCFRCHDWASTTDRLFSRLSLSFSARRTPLRIYLFFRPCYSMALAPRLSAHPS